MTVISGWSCKGILVPAFKIKMPMLTFSSWKICTYCSASSPWEWGLGEKKVVSDGKSEKSNQWRETTKRGRATEREKQRQKHAVQDRGNRTTQFHQRPHVKKKKSPQPNSPCRQASTAHRPVTSAATHPPAPWRSSSPRPQPSPRFSAWKGEHTTNRWAQIPWVRHTAAKNEKKNQKIPPQQPQRSGFHHRLTQTRQITFPSFPTSPLCSSSSTRLCDRSAQTRAEERQTRRRDYQFFFLLLQRFSFCCLRHTHVCPFLLASQPRLCLVTTNKHTHTWMRSMGGRPICRSCSANRLSSSWRFTRRARGLPLHERMFCVDDVNDCDNDETAQRCVLDERAKKEKVVKRVMMMMLCVCVCSAGHDTENSKRRGAKESTQTECGRTLLPLARERHFGKKSGLMKSVPPQGEKVSWWNRCGIEKLVGKIFKLVLFLLNWAPLARGGCCENARWQWKTEQSNLEIHKIIFKLGVAAPSCGPSGPERNTHRVAR